MDSISMNTLTRRGLLTVAAGATAIMATSRAGYSQQAAPAAMSPSANLPFAVPPLAYGFSALEPNIDAQTMELHHDRHHGAAVATLNDLAKTAPQIVDHPVEHVLANLNDVPESIRTAVRNNLGSHANHSMFWSIMGPNGGTPGADVLQAIDRDLGGLDKFKTDFNAAGGKVFGSGWVFVTVTQEGRLAVETRPNQDTPLMEGKRVLFGNDVWEHSYYLKYQNRRPDYLKAWWNSVNWQKISERYAAAKAGSLAI